MNAKKFQLFLVAALLFCLALFLYVKFSDDKSFRVVFFNIGQGDSALIRFDDGEKMLVDCGPDRKVLAKLGQYLPFYDRTIDYLVATHPDLDHYGGCVDVLKRYKVKNIFINGAKKENDPFWQAWDQTMRDEGAVVRVIAAPDKLIIASTTLEFLAPDNSFGLLFKQDDSNDHSIVFRLSHANEKFLFTGDAEQPLENALLKKYCPIYLATSTPATATCPSLQSDILKVGHHGSDSSSGKQFLQAVAPKTAVVSVGKNRYGHPSLRVIKRLERQQAEIIRTDLRGDLMFE